MSGGESPVRKALDKLKEAMFKPDPELANPLRDYSYKQLTELVEEIEGEMERLPSFALGKLKVLSDELENIVNELNRRNVEGY